jgi:chromosome segregation ATPase
MNILAQCELTSAEVSEWMVRHAPAHDGVTVTWIVILLMALLCLVGRLRDEMARVRRYRQSLDEAFKQKAKAEAQAIEVEVQVSSYKEKLTAMSGKHKGMCDRYDAFVGEAEGFERQAKATEAELRLELAGTHRAIDEASSRYLRLSDAMKSANEANAGASEVIEKLKRENEELAGRANDYAQQVAELHREVDRLIEARRKDQEERQQSESDAADEREKLASRSSVLRAQLDQLCFKAGLCSGQARTMQARLRTLKDSVAADLRYCEDLLAAVVNVCPPEEGESPSAQDGSHGR